MQQIKKKRVKTRTGVIIRRSGEKTAVMEYTETKKHSLYGKPIRLKKETMIHDEQGKAKVGDKVKIKESRPISKSKSWVLSEILKK